MRSRGIIVGDLGRDQFARMGKVAEQCLVQKLLPHPAFEAFDEALLHGFARCDLAPLNSVLSAQFQDRVRGQVRPVIADDHARSAALLDQRRQFPHHTAA